MSGPYHNYLLFRTLMFYFKVFLVTLRVFGLKKITENVLELSLE